MRRLWTEEEKATAIANRGTLTAAEIGRLIGRTTRAVHMFFLAQGIAQKRHQRPELPEFIRAHHAQGWSDAEMAAEWSRLHPDAPLSRQHLGDIRAQRLGLPHNAYSAHRRQRVAEKTREQCQAAGVKNLAEVRRLAYDAFARRQGWPEDLRPRAVQILKLLYEQGPHTRQQIAEAIGMPWKGSRKSLVSNDPEGSYLAHLIARGLVVQLPRLVKGKGRGKSVHLYAIAPGIQRGAAS